MNRANTDCSSNILFIDSTCVLCDRFTQKLVSFLAENSTLRIASLHGEQFQELVTAKQPVREDAIVYLKNRVAHIGEAAVIELRHEVRPSLRVILCLVQLVPKRLRAFAYQWVAKNRSQWFGSQDACSLQTASNPHSWRYVS